MPHDGGSLHVACAGGGRSLRQPCGEHRDRLGGGALGWAASPTQIDVRPMGPSGSSRPQGKAPVAQRSRFLWRQLTAGGVVICARSCPGSVRGAGGRLRPPLTRSHADNAILSTWAAAYRDGHGGTQWECRGSPSAWDGHRGALPSSSARSGSETEGSLPCAQFGSRHAIEIMWESACPCPRFPEIQGRPRGDGPTPLRVVPSGGWTPAPCAVSEVAASLRSCDRLDRRNRGHARVSR